MTPPAPTTVRAAIANLICRAQMDHATFGEVADAILAALPGLIDEAMVERAAQAVRGSRHKDEWISRDALHAALRAAFGGEGTA